MGMHPVGFYDLRDAAPSRCRSSRPRSGRSTPTSWRATRSGSSPRCSPTSDRRFFTADLQRRLEAFLAGAACSAPSCSRWPTAPRPSAAWTPRTPTASSSSRRRRSSSRPSRSTSAWYRELERISAVAADIGGVAVHAHQPPHAAGPRHRRALRADEGPRHRDDRRHPGPAALGRPGRPAAPDVVPRAGRAARVPRRRRLGARRRRCGCASARSRRAASRSPRPAARCTTS